MNRNVKYRGFTFVGIENLCLGVVNVIEVSWRDVESCADCVLKVRLLLFQEVESSGLLSPNRAFTTACEFTRDRRREVPSDVILNEVGIALSEALLYSAREIFLVDPPPEDCRIPVIRPKSLSFDMAFHA